MPCELVCVCVCVNMFVREYRCVLVVVVMMFVCFLILGLGS